MNSTPLDARSIGRRAAPALLALLLAAPVAAQSSKAERAEAFLREVHRLRLFNGTALVVDDREVLFEGAFGFARLGDGESGAIAEDGEGRATARRVENELDTRFRIASLTKQFTAALVMRLAEEGRIDLQGTVRQYIPEYPSPQGDRVTVHQLLTHTSGIPSYTNVPGFMDERAGTPMTPAEILAVTWERPLEFEPGTAFAYSNSGYVLLGWIAERVTGRPYGELLAELLLEPLGLADTGYDRFPSPPDGHAAGYTRTLEGYEPARHIDPSVPFSAGMMYSTVRDLHRWSRALVGWDEGPFAEPGTADRMMTPELEGYGYGLGVATRTIGRDDSVRVIEHTGGIFGFASVLRVFPDHDRMIVLLDNTSSGLRPIVDGLTNILWGAEAVAPKPAIAERLLPIARTAGAEPAIERYRTFRRTRPDQYDYGPGQLMQLANHFHEAGDTATAILFLEAQTEDFPDSPVARFALSELYAAGGDTASAVAQLETALMSHPGEPHLLEAILALGIEPAAPLRLPARPVKREALARLVGSYRIDPTTMLEIELGDDGLTAARTGEPAFRLLPQSETTFLLEGSKIQLTFALDGGSAASVSVLEAGQRVTFPRVPSPR